jgi:hypothetical protein
LAEIKRKFNGSDKTNSLASKEIEILAKRLENVIREEIHKFYSLESDKTQFNDPKTV